MLRKFKNSTDDVRSWGMGKCLLVVTSLLRRPFGGSWEAWGGKIKQVGNTRKGAFTQVARARLI